MAADANKVFYGLSNVHIAFRSDGGTAEAPAWETPVLVSGAVGFAPDAETEEYKFYADNGVYYATYTDNGYTGDLEMAKFPDAILAEMFGWLQDSLGGLLETNDMPHKDFAMLAQVEGNRNGRRIVWYNCAGGKPSQEYSTTEEGIEVQTQTMPLTITPVKLSNGRRATKYHIDADPENAEAMTAYDGFFDAVYTPQITVPEGRQVALKKSNTKIDAQEVYNEGNPQR